MFPKLISTLDNVVRCRILYIFARKCKITTVFKKILKNCLAQLKSGDHTGVTRMKLFPVPVFFSYSHVYRY